MPVNGPTPLRPVAWNGTADGNPLQTEAGAVPAPYAQDKTVFGVSTHFPGIGYPNDTLNSQLKGPNIALCVPVGVPTSYVNLTKNIAWPAPFVNCWRNAIQHDD